MAGTAPMYATADGRMVRKVEKMRRRFKKRGRNCLKGSAIDRWKWLEVDVFGD